MDKILNSEFSPEMLEVVEGLLKMCVDRENQINDLNKIIEGLQAKIARECKPEVDESEAMADGIEPGNGILILDESKPFLKKLALLLKGYGYDVVGTASEHEKGVKMINELSPGLVMIDFTLPDMKGLETSREIKAKYPNVKIIIMSEQLEETTVFQAVKYGADEYLPKPLSPARLIQLMKVMLSA